MVARVRVVAADGVEDRHAVLLELVRRDLERDLALAAEAALHTVGDVRELDARVADGRPAVELEGARLLADRRGCVPAPLERPGNLLSESPSTLAEIPSKNCFMLELKSVMVPALQSGEGQFRVSRAGREETAQSLQRAGS